MILIYKGICILSTFIDSIEWNIYKYYNVIFCFA
jgi:hypothetical protein